MFKQTVFLSLMCLSLPALAGECEDNFQKSGNALMTTTYTSSVSVPDLSARDALAQMRGILVAEKMDVIAEDPEGGTLLVEQRQSSKSRPIPTTITTTDGSGGAKVSMEIKMERGMFSSADKMQPYMCGLFTGLKGGSAGKVAAAQGANADNNEATANQDVLTFSRMIANEANKNAIAVNARHKGRKYTLTGRIQSLMEDGDQYNLIFDVPEISEMVLAPLPHQAQFKVSVSCLFNQNQLTSVLSLREGQKVTLTGTVDSYNDIRHVIWLRDCTKAK